MRQRAQFSRYSTPLSTILQFSSEMSKNWGIGPPCLHPLWIYCTGQQHKTSLFPCLFFCLSFLFTFVAPFAQVLFHTCTITSPFLPNADFPFLKHLPSPSRSRGMFLLAFTVTQTFTFLSSNVWAYKNCLDRCEEKWVWKLCGQWTSRRS
jgi:hypothetical protein